MSTDDLWALHEEIASRLAAALLAEKRVLENRLKQLKGGVEAERGLAVAPRRNAAVGRGLAAAALAGPVRRL